MRTTSRLTPLNPVEELISEETLIDEVEIPGLPQMKRKDADANIGGNSQPG